MLSLGMGKIFNRPFEIDFSARMNYINAEIDRYAETVNNPSGAGLGLALEFDKQQIESLTSDISLTVSKAISREFGVVLPRASLSWVHDFNVNDEGLRARFVNDPFSTNFIQTGLGESSSTTIFEIPKDKSDSDFAKFTVGMNVLLPKGLTFSVDYSTLLASRLIEYGYLSLSLRKDF